MKLFWWSIVISLVIIGALLIVFKIYGDKEKLNKIETSVAVVVACSQIMVFIILVFTLISVPGPKSPTKVYVNTEYSLTILGFEGTPASLPYYKEDKTVNDACKLYYDKSCADMYSSSRTSGEGYYDYFEIIPHYKNISFSDYWKALFHLTFRYAYKYDVTLVKKTEVIDTGGEFRKVINDRTTTYEISDYVLEEDPEKDLDGYFGKNIHLVLYYNTDSVDEDGHIKDYIVISANEIKTEE